MGFGYRAGPRHRSTVQAAPRPAIGIRASDVEVMVGRTARSLSFSPRWPGIGCRTAGGGDYDWMGRFRLTWLSWWTENDCSELRPGRKPVEPRWEPQRAKSYRSFIGQVSWLAPSRNFGCCDLTKYRVYSTKYE